MPKRKLGILLSTPPEDSNLATAVALIEEALKQDVQPYLYLLDEGVKNASENKIEALYQKGLKLFLCAYGAQRYHIPISDKGVFGGLAVLSDLVKGCDRFITLN
ncbi:MAG: DsrE family protein [Nitrospiria bacterium]